MKRSRVIGIIIALLVLGCGGVAVVAAGVGVWFWWTLRGGSVDAIARRLPPDTGALFVMRGFADLALEFRALGEGLPDAPPDPAEAELRARFEQTFGFKVDDPQGWKSTGLDFARPWGGAVGGALDPDAAEYYLFLPVTDGEAASLFVARLLAGEGVSLEPTTFGAHPGFLVEQRGAFSLDDDYLVAVVSPRSDFDAGTALRVFLDRDRSDALLNRPSFKDVLDAVTEDWHLFGYLSPEAMAQAWAEADRDAAELLGSLGAAGAGYAARLTNEALDSQLVLLQTTETPSALVGGPDGLSGKVSGSALAVARLGLDYKSLWTAARQDPETARELDELARGLRDEWGVDLQSDIVENLGGPITLVTLAAGETPDVAAWVPVKDAAKAASMLDAVTARLRDARMSISTDKIEGQSWYFNDTFAVGLVGQHLVVSVGAGRMATLKSDLTGGQTSFTAQLPAKVRGDLSGGPPVYLYLDVAQTMRTVGSSPLASRFVDHDTRVAASALSGVSFGVSAQGRQLTVESAWHAPPGGFGAALRELAAREAREAEYQRLREEVRQNVERLRSAQVRAYNETRRFAACGSEAQARAQASAPYDWVTDACWSGIGWAPTAPTRGGYWVTTTGGWIPSFKITALVDLDGDGQPAEIVADPYRNATVTTGPDVY